MYNLPKDQSSKRLRSRESAFDVHLQRSMIATKHPLLGAQPWQLPSTWLIDGRSAPSPKNCVKSFPQRKTPSKPRLTAIRGYVDIDYIDREAALAPPLFFSQQQLACSNFAATLRCTDTRLFSSLGRGYFL